MLEMNISNRQVAIAGRILEGETEKTISGALVEITVMPKIFKTQLSMKKLQYGSQWGKMWERTDRKITTRDGYFHFTNLPPGEYVLEISLPGSASGYNKVSKKLEVLSSLNGKIQTTMADIVLSPTGIKGTVTDADDPKKWLENAKIQIKGTQNQTFSDQRGNYRLLGLESPQSGQRTITLIISATGYQRVEKSLDIQAGKVIASQNISLKHK